MYQCPLAIFKLPTGTITWGIHKQREAMSCIFTHLWPPSCWHPSKGSWKTLTVKWNLGKLKGNRWPSRSHDACPPNHHIWRIETNCSHAACNCRSNDSQISLRLVMDSHTKIAAITTSDGTFYRYLRLTGWTYLYASNIQ
jgi:hypothetical protein